MVVVAESGVGRGLAPPAVLSNVRVVANDDEKAAWPLNAKLSVVSPSRPPLSSA